MNLPVPNRPHCVSALTLVVTLGGALVDLAYAQPPYENLQVLPADISRSQLNEIMLGNLRGLGLRRLAGEGCLYCHVGDLERPRTEWDYASDAKPMKEKARVMLAMVQAINDEYLERLDHRLDEGFTVTCATCHAGRTDPRPLPNVLWAAYEAGGIDSATARYRGLRERYFGSDAYDFRVSVLPAIAMRMANNGTIDDAIALAALNIEANPGVASAEAAWAVFRMERIIDEEGVDAALVELQRMESEISTEAMSPGLLDGLGWRLWRSDRQPQAIAIIEANYLRFPDEYVPNESMAFILSDQGEQDRAEAILERWLEKYPDHARARRLLTNMRGG